MSADRRMLRESRRACIESTSTKTPLGILGADKMMMFRKLGIEGVYNSNSEHLQSMMYLYELMFVWGNGSLRNSPDLSVSLRKPQDLSGTPAISQDLSGSLRISQDLSGSQELTGIRQGFSGSRRISREVSRSPRGPQDLTGSQDF